MNFQFSSTGPHVAPAESPWKMEFNYRYVNKKSPLYFSVVNMGNMREFLLEISAHAAMLWDYDSYDTDRFMEAYCAQYFGEKLDEMGIPYIKPAGGHAIYIDARAFASHIPLEQFPGQAVACAIYLEGGVRACEIGGIMFGKHDPKTGEYIAPPMELVRLAFPRRVYTQSHFDYVLEVLPTVVDKLRQMSPLYAKFIKEGKGGK